jgi:AraC-like DNA-binding protein
MAPLEIKSRDRADFVAAASSDELGPLRFVKTESAPATVEHEAVHVAQTKERRFRVLLSVHGRLALRHAGQEAVLEEGDFALLDDAVPFRIDFDEPTQSLCVAVSPSTIKAYMPAPASVCGLRMPTDRPLNRVASTMLLGLWEQIESDELRSEHRPALARSFLQVFAATYAVSQVSRVEGSTMAAARRAEIKQHIETHLRSPELTPTTIAAALGLSRRYLRMLFAAENDSVTAYIRRRRLEECAWELSQPQWRGRSITETASDWGFRSVTHFARAFKTVYGATPSAFKHQRAEATAD